MYILREFTLLKKMQKIVPYALVASLKVGRKTMSEFRVSNTLKDQYYQFQWTENHSDIPF